VTATDELDPTALALPVVAVVVTRDPGDWLEECLASIGAQDYPDLSVLVIDAASEEPVLPRVAEVLPAAFVRRLDVNPGFGPATNEVLGMVEGAAFYVFCHDDVVLDPTVIWALVEEAFRSNAGVVGPKLVMWDDPSRLLDVGMAADKGGVLMPMVERGELDQEQHDSVRDVFVVPGAVTMVRSDLFATLGGFDTGIEIFGEDLDLCWRAQVAGARVLVVPAARARHREGLVDRVGPDQAALLRNRHRLRTVLTCYRTYHLLWIIPQLLFLSFAELLYTVMTGSRPHAHRVVNAWWWNWQHRGEIRARRRVLKAIRRFPDREVRKLQVGGSARITRFVRGELAASKLGEELEDLSGELEDMVRRRPRKLAAVAWGLAALLFVVGTRSLLFHRIPSVAGFAPFDQSPVDLLRQYLSGWQPAGLGSAAAQPTAFALLALGGSVLLGHMGMLQQVLVLGAIPAGAVGMWRLTRPLDSPNARGVGLLLYTVVPLPWNCVAHGNWAGLILYGAAPWLLTALAEVAGELPGDEAPRERPFWAAALALGLLLACVAAFVPLAVPLLLAVAVGLTAGGLIGGRPNRLLGPISLAAGASVVAVVLHLPWAVALALGDRWSWAGVAAGGVRAFPASDLLRFETGPVGISWLGWSIPLAASVVLVLGRSWRLRWGLRCWGVALMSWTLALLGGHHALGLPPAEVLLAPGAAALALAGALGVSAFELDLRGFRFGWRQVASIVGGVAVVLAILPIALDALDGAWHLRAADHAGSLGPLAAQPVGGARTLWIGAPETLPIAGFHLDDDLDFALTTDTFGGVLDRWATSGKGAIDVLRQSILAAESGSTDQLGTLVAPFGVKYIVLVDRAAPERTDETLIPVPADIDDMAEHQLDLRKLEVEPALGVFQNVAPASVRTLHAGLSPAAVAQLDSPKDPLAAALALPAGSPVLTAQAGRPEASGRVGAGELVVGSPADDRWRVTVDGKAQSRREVLGWANGWAVPAGAASLTYETSPVRLLVVLLQVLAWVAAVVLVVRGWRRRR
jgi:GT2 family glycosyltransferase